MKRLLPNVFTSHFFGMFINAIFVWRMKRRHLTEIKEQPHKLKVKKYHVWNKIYPFIQENCPLPSLPVLVRAMQQWHDNLPEITAMPYEWNIKMVSPRRNKCFDPTKMTDACYIAQTRKKDLICYGNIKKFKAIRIPTVKYPANC